jgi:hypothetical protein
MRTSPAEKLMTDLDTSIDNSNPYNQNKPWHKDGGEATVDNANTLFVPKRPAQKAKDTKVENTEGDDVGSQGTGTGPHDFEKRWKDLKAHHDKTVRELREQLNTKGSAVGDTATKTPPKTKEELEQLRQKDPAAFEAMKSIAQLIALEETSEVKAKLSDIEKRELELAKERAMSEVAKAHPDIEELRNDDDFHMWAESQPQEIQDWIYNNPTNSQLAIKAINLFKLETGKASKGSSSEKAPSKTATNGADSLVSSKTAGDNAPVQGKVWSREEIKRLSMDEYDRLEKEIDKAIREGRVI